MGRHAATRSADCGAHGPFPGAGESGAESFAESILFFAGDAWCLYAYTCKRNGSRIGQICGQYLWCSESYLRECIGRFL